VDAQRPASEPRTAVGRAVLTHLSSQDVVKVVYGAIVGLAVVVGLESHAGTPTQTAATVIATAVAMALAEAYSEFVGIETRERRHVAGREIPSLATDAGAVAIGAGFPAVFFILAALRAMELETAFTLAKWSGLGLLFAYSWAASRLAGSSLTRASMHASAVGAIGVALIAVKALLH
jgi:hypothetical protein